MLTSPETETRTAWTQESQHDPVRVLLVLSFLAWPPAPGGGDTTIPGLCHEQAVSAAELGDMLGTIASVDVGLASEIGAAIGNGSIGLGYMDAASAASSNARGAADGNTILLKPAGDLGDRTATLIHEWHHIRQRNGAPGVGSEQSLSFACREMFAYAAEIEHMCARMTISDDSPFLCSSWNSRNQLFKSKLAQCSLPVGTGAPDPGIACQENPNCAL